MNLEQKLQEMKRRDKLAEEGGGHERRARQHKEGKMSARERMNARDSAIFCHWPPDSSRPSLNHLPSGVR